VVAPFFIFHQKAITKNAAWDMTPRGIFRNMIAKAILNINFGQRAKKYFI
jgi:hypothetical protein